MSCLFLLGCVVYGCSVVFGFWLFVFLCLLNSVGLFVVLMVCCVLIWFAL